MRNIVIILCMIFVTSVFADDKAPAPFTDSGIKRKLKDGRVQKFDGNKYKIVRRGVKSKPKVVVKEKRVYKKNTVKGFLGYGPNDLDRVNSNRVDLEFSPFVGVGYQRHLNGEFSIEVIGTTNESLMLGGGFSF